ncbi:MAG: tetratricopeptide repeat protein [Cyclobacteriaceae bacterium]
MHKTVFAILFTLFSFQAFAQSKIDSLEKVLTIVENDSLKIHTYLRLAQAYHRLDQNLSLDYNIQAENLAKNNKLEPLIAEAKYRKGTALSNLNLFEQAELEFDTALIIFSKLGDKIRMAQVKTDWARLLQSQSRPKEAIALYFEALPLTRELGDKNAEARIYNFLGENYKIQKQYTKAIEHYEKALLLVRELNFKPGISACLTNLGSVYIEVGDMDKALTYHEEALIMKTETGDKLGASRVLSNLGEIYSLKEQFDLAGNYLDRAYSLAQEVNNMQHLAVVEYGLARNAFKRGDLKKCIQMANNIVTNLHSLKDLDLAVKTHDLLFQAYSKNGDKQAAVYNAGIRAQLSDSLYNEKILAVTNELDAQYQNEQKAQEIALLESENQLQSLQIQKRENERNYLIALAIVILLVMGLVYNQYLIKQKANARLRELDKLKSDFFANISHEFRTPLSLIMAPLKERISDTTSEKDRHSYQVMYRNADRLLNLIDQLLDLSKLESKSVELKKLGTEVGHFFKIIVASFSSLAEHKKIRFNCSLPVGNQSIDVDQDVIQKICYNLLSNAFKFTTDEGEVSFIVTLQNNKLKITVSDTGSGIPTQDREKVFDRFFQSSNGTQLGTGIGLALTKELVEFHGGQITLEDSSAKGSTFTVAIPVQSTQDFTVAQEQFVIPSLDHLMIESEEENNLAEHKPVVLIIEDNPDLRNYLAEILGETYTVCQASNGALGVVKAKEIIPDLIISDVMMPEKDGVEVCIDLKTATETDHIPIILLTARADQESKIRGLTTGADDYLLKPFDPKELRVRISNLLAQRVKLKEKYSQLLLLEPAEMEVASAQDLFLRKAKEIVSAHLDDSDFSSEAFCAEVGMSRMQLHRKLKALTGQSATAFVRHQRLIKASQLLGRGEPVSQVAYAVGFSSLSYFTKNFKQEFGVAPSEYVVRAK